MRTTLFMLVLLTSNCGWAQDRLPIALVIQQKAALVEEIDTNVEIAAPFAEHLAEHRKLRPVVWSRNDSIFRSFLEQKIIVDVAEVPTDAQIRAAIKAVQAKYVFYVSAFRVGGNIQGSIMAQDSGGRVVWRDTRTISIKLNDMLDAPGTAESIGRTWAAQLNDGILSKLPAKPIDLLADPKLEPPPVAPIISDDPGPLTRRPAESIDVPKVLEQVKRQVLQNDRPGAILTLREAIDIDPFVSSLREELVRLLMEVGESESAALEAERFALLAEGSGEYLIGAAQMWLDLGRLEPAQEALNQAKARLGETAEALRVQGMIALAAGETATSSELFVRSLELKDHAETQYALALVAALQGQVEPLEAALQSLHKKPVSEPERSYRWAMATLDARMDLLAEQFRDALRQATGQPKSAEAIAKTARLQKVSETLVTLLDRVEPPKNHYGSHELRQLAHRLLVQAASECSAYAQSGDEETGGEAAISLGEALKALQPAREKFQQERAGR